MKLAQLGSSTGKRTIASMRPYFPQEDIEEMTSGFEKILRSGRLTLGSYATEFEKQFASYVGTRFAIAANSGTSTLEMIYRSIGIEGKEVVTPTNTHIATSNAVIFAGGKPVLADIEQDTLCLDVEDAFSKVNRNTKAMVVVHLAGLIHPKIDEIRKRCEEQEILLIEDAAHAHGATIDGRKAGSLGHAASFSFYPAKVVTSVEGGMVTTNDQNISYISKELRNHGSDSSGLQVRLGYNWRMSEVHSLVGLVQLRRIEEIVANKNMIASTYITELGGVRGVRTIRVPPNIRHSYYKFPIILDRGKNVRQIQYTLKIKFGIETGSIYYPPCHLQPIYKELYPELSGTMPVSEDVLARTISIPIQAGMSVEDATYVAQSLNGVVRSL
jgi:perosamine synthetase